MQNFVDFELDNINFGVYARAFQGKLNQFQKYTLRSICNHMGSLDSGHYTAFCKIQCSEKWAKFDDHKVSDINSQDIVTHNAYILFYQALK